MDADVGSHEYETLLPGESKAMTNDRLDDARHWHRVYEELCAFKERLLKDIASMRELVQEHGRMEVAHDEMVLNREYDRLRRRREYWREQKEVRSA